MKHLEEQKDGLKGVAAGLATDEHWALTSSTAILLSTSNFEANIKDASADFTSTAPTDAASLKFVGYLAASGKGPLPGSVLPKSSQFQMIGLPKPAASLTQTEAEEAKAGAEPKIIKLGTNKAAAMKQAKQFSKTMYTFLVAPGGKVAAKPKGKEAAKAMAALADLMKEKGAIKAPPTSPKEMGVKTVNKPATKSSSAPVTKSEKKIEKAVVHHTPKSIKSKSAPTHHKSKPMPTAMKRSSMPVPTAENKRAIAKEVKSMTNSVAKALSSKLKKAEAKVVKAKTAVKTVAAKADAKKNEAEVAATKKGKSPAEAKVKARVVANKIKAKAAAKKKAAVAEVKALAKEIKAVKAAKKACGTSATCLAKKVEKIEETEVKRQTVKKAKKVAAEKKQMKKDPVKYAAKRAAKFSAKMKKYGVPQKPSSERLDRIGKNCGEKNTKCIKKLTAMANENQRRQFVAARSACKGNIKCTQARIKAQNKKAASRQAALEKNCKGKKGTKAHGRCVEQGLRRFERRYKSAARKAMKGPGRMTGP